MGPQEGGTHRGAVVPRPTRVHQRDGGSGRQGSGAVQPGGAEGGRAGGAETCDLFDISISFIVLVVLVVLFPTFSRNSTRFGIDFTLCWSILHLTREKRLWIYYTTPTRFVFFSFEQVLFSAHGVPKSYIDAGDPYKQQIEACVRLISQRVDVINANRMENTDSSSSGGGKAEGTEAREGAVTYHLSYQSRVGPVEWLRPYTDSKIHELADKGCKNLVVVPVSFVSEHIETLEEIDMEYREVAEEAGIERWRRWGYTLRTLFLKCLRTVHGAINAS